MPDGVKGHTAKALDLLMVGVETAGAERAEEGPDGEALQDISRSSFVLRKAYAEGANLQEEIDRMTARALSAGPTIQLMSYSRKSHRFIEGPMYGVADARNFFQKTLGSRLTLMDVIDLADIASPVLDVRAIRIEHSEQEDGEHGLTLRMQYAARDPFLSRFYSLGIERDASIDVMEGVPFIVRNSVSLSKGTRGQGIGMRFLLATALFAKRHGIASWEDDIQFDGLLVWPSLGARVPEERVDTLGAKIRMLYSAGILSGSSPSQLGYFDIAGFTVENSQVRNWQAFDHWLKNQARLPVPTIEEMPTDTMPIGLMLMQRHAVSAEFFTESILDGLLDERLPGSIERRRNAMARTPSRDELGELALFGLERDYAMAVIEQGVYDCAFDGGAYAAIAGGQIAAASGMIMSLLK